MYLLRYDGERNRFNADFWDSVADEGRPISLSYQIALIRQGFSKIAQPNIFMLFLDIIHATCEILKALSYLQLS